jgi:hypothetical protein
MGLHTHDQEGQLRNDIQVRLAWLAAFLACAGVLALASWH